MKMIAITPQKVVFKTLHPQAESEIQERNKTSAIYAEKFSHSPANIYRANFIPFLGLTNLPKPQSFEDFMMRFNKLNISASEFINQTIKHDSFIGNGNFSYVYNFPEKFDVKDFVLKTKRMLIKIPPLGTQIEQIADKSPLINIGQTIAGISKDFSILKKVEGIETIPSHFAEKSYSEIKQKYIENIKIIATMPQEAFDNYVKKVKILNENLIALDNIGLGNLLVDAKNLSFNPIDTESSSIFYYQTMDILLRQLVGDAKEYVYKPQELENYNKDYKKVVYKLLLAYNKPKEMPEALCYPCDFGIPELKHTIIGEQLRKAKTENNPQMFEDYLNKLFWRQTQSQ